MLSAFSSPGVYMKYVWLPYSTALTHSLIYNNAKYYLFFIDLICAINGTHIPCIPPSDRRNISWNHKGFFSQNCLVPCDFDLHFTYVLSGWEGSMADALVFHDAWMSDLAIPSGKYYLTDVGFPLCHKLLVPYRRQRYHLAEWGRAWNRWVLLVLSVL